MSQQNIDINIRYFIPDDVDEYRWIHQHQKPSVNPFDEGYFSHEHITSSFFKSQCEYYDSLRDNHDAFIFGVFNQDNKLVGIVELITLSDDLTHAQIKYKVYNLYFDLGYEPVMINKAILCAKDLGYSHLVAHCALHDYTSINFYIAAGFSDEGAQLIQECDQVCWPTKHVLTYHD